MVTIPPTLLWLLTNIKVAIEKAYKGDSTNELEALNETFNEFWEEVIFFEGEDYPVSWKGAVNNLVQIFCLCVTESPNNIDLKVGLEYLIQFKQELFK